MRWRRRLSSLTFLYIIRSVPAKKEWLTSTPYFLGMNLTCIIFNCFVWLLHVVVAGAGHSLACKTHYRIPYHVERVPNLSTACGECVGSSRFDGVEVRGAVCRPPAKSLSWPKVGWHRTTWTTFEWFLGKTCGKMDVYQRKQKNDLANGRLGNSAADRPVVWSASI